MGNIVIKAPKLHIKVKQISKVYFAKEKIDNEGNICFERIKEGWMNNNMYIVIETENIEEGDSIKVNIHQYVERDKIVLLKEQKGEELIITVGNYKDNGGLVTQAITPIILGIERNSSKEVPYYMLQKENLFYVTISVSALKNGEINKEVCYNLDNFRNDFSNAPNFWYQKNNRFYLRKKKPIIVIDPGHGYSKSTDLITNIGAQSRIYKYKVKGNEKKIESADIENLPQYVLDDLEKWIVDNKELDDDRTEHILVLRVSRKMRQLLLKKGFECYLTRDNEDVKELPSESAIWKRMDFANEKNADYFISIHADGNIISSSGSHAIYTNNIDDSIGRELAIDMLRFYDVVDHKKNHPLKDTAQNVGLLNKSENTKRKKLVERRTLVELGYITNPKDAKAMFGNIDKMAEQLVQGLLYNIDKYF